MLRTARTYLVLVGAVCIGILGVHDFFRSPGLTLGERVGTLVFRLVLAAIGFAHFAYRLKLARDERKGLG